MIPKYAECNETKKNQEKCEILVLHSESFHHKTSSLPVHSC